MSLTIIGLLAGALSTALKAGGVEIGTAELTGWLLSLGQIVGGLLVYVGRVRLGDITLFGTRK